MLGKYPRTVYESIKELNIPIVLIDVYEEYANEFHNIRVDDEGGMYEATNFMIKMVIQKLDLQELLINRLSIITAI